MTVTVGFLGAGFIAESHATMLEVSGADAAFGPVFDPDSSRAASFVLRHGGAVAATESEVIDGSDAVYVCTWTSEHPRLVEAAARAGRAVFCEKPLGVDLDAARLVADTVASAGVINQVGLVLRDSPAFRYLRTLVDDPADGEVLTVVFRDDQYLPVRGIYGSRWRADPARAGAGTLIEHSIHDLDLLEWLFGPVSALSARTSQRHGIEGIEDVAGVHLEFASGATAHLISVWHDVLGRPSGRRLEVFRRRGWYALEGDLDGPVRVQRTSEADIDEADALLAGGQVAEPGEVIVDDGVPAWRRGEHTPDDVLAGRDLVRHLLERGCRLRYPDAGFIESVAAGRPATPTVADALRAHVLVDAAYRSATDAGTWVEVSS